MVSQPNGALWLIPALPLATAVVNLFWGRRLGRWAGWLASASVALSFVVSLALVAKPAGDRLFLQHLFDWISVGRFVVGMDLRLDSVSATMILVITGIGALIHVYAIGYMAGDPRYGRFFSYMNLFVFFMLMLVLGANYLVLYLGWEGVGLCSYLFIGFWSDVPANAEAAKKAFITTRIGDTLMLVGLALIVFRFGTLDFEAVFGTAGSVLTKDAATAIALLLFAGAIGKSAQVPLHVWLPDAMAGPTPVSALIHAATMVTAGVYLVVRSHVLFENAYVVADLAAGLGAATLLMAGLIALVQVDIKRVIAYSTMSQIGYMFVGAGRGAYPNALFHRMTHAFFKALLFMAAGLAIHAIVGEQDIRQLSGIGKLMPFTKIVFLVGSLALVGIPPFSGFFSKDSILASALDHGWYGIVIFVAGLIGTFLTGIYAFRLYFIVFTGEPTAFAREHFHRHQGKEAPFAMRWPVALLALLAAIAGFLQFAPEWHPLTTWLDPVAPPLVEPTSTQEWLASALAILAGVSGMAVSWAIYSAKRVRAPKPVHLFERKFYWDELYDLIWYRPADLVARGLYAFIEKPLIAGSLAAVSGGAGFGSRELGRAQNGLVRSYALALASGLAVLIVVFV